MSSTDPTPQTENLAAMIAASRRQPLSSDETRLLAETMRTAQRTASNPTVGDLQTQLEAQGPTMSPDQLATATSLMRGLTMVLGQTPADGITTPGL